MYFVVTEVISVDVAGAISVLFAGAFLGEVSSVMTGWMPESPALESEQVFISVKRK